MKPIIQRFLDRFIPISLKQEPEDYRRASLVVLLVITVTIYSVFFSLFTFYLKLNWIAYLNVFVIFAGIFTYTAFRLTHNLTLTAWLFFVFSILFMFFLGHVGGGQYSFGPIFYPLAPIMGFGIGNRKIGIAQSIITIAWIFLGVPLMEKYVLTQPFVMIEEHYNLMFTCSIITMIFMISLIMLIHEYNREQLIKKLRIKDQTLLRQEKMASLGALTAGVAHEINNPLNFVYSNSQALRMDLSEIDELLEEVHKLEDATTLGQARYLVAKAQELDTKFLQEEMKLLIDSIERGAQRTRKIVAGLNSFSRNEPGKFLMADVHEGLDSTLTILNSNLENKIEVIKDYGILPEIECQLDALNQVFLNILINAIQSIEEEGKIYIKTWLNSPFVYLSFQDTGIGIPREVQEKIFEPFFTTKEIGTGTGLGLSISYGIISQHGGRIEVHSEEGKGATFTLVLPIRQKDPT